MIPALIFFALALGCLGWAGVLLFRRWTDIRLLDPMTIKEEQHRAKREAMIRKRFERMRDERSRPFRRLARATKRRAESLYDEAARRLRVMENQYDNTKTAFSALTPTTNERVKTLVSEARSLMRDLKWADAEKRFLEVLALDPHHVDAYKGLGQIYLKQKLYPQARETFAFILKMNRADDTTYAALADIEEAAGHVHEAELYRLQAVELGGKQAHRHAELAQHYLEAGDLIKAWPPAKRAVELEQNSSKYVELALEIAVKSGDAAEARFYYQKFRLLSDDRARFQYWREKVEELERSIRTGTGPEASVPAAPATSVVASEAAPKKRRTKKVVEKEP